LADNSKKIGGGMLHPFQLKKTLILMNLF